MVAAAASCCSCRRSGQLLARLIDGLHLILLPAQSSAPASSPSSSCRLQYLLADSRWAAVICWLNWADSVRHCGEDV